MLVNLKIKNASELQTTIEKLEGALQTLKWCVYELSGTKVEVELDGQEKE